MILAIITWILFGFLAGLIAKYLMPGPDGGGFVFTTLIGIVGALIGGFIANALGFGVAASGIAGFLVSLLIAVLGAMLLLVVYRLATGRSLSV